MNRAVFLDRDGVINRKATEGEYITRWEDVEFLPETASAVSLLKENGFQVIVVTNQRCVSKGLISVDGLEQLHQRIRAELHRASATIDDFYYCPHDLDPPCDCRKPKPGMLLEASREHHISLPDSWMIGDSESDLLAGRTAGCKTVLIADQTREVIHNADVIAVSLIDAVKQVLAVGSVGPPVR